MVLIALVLTTLVVVSLTIYAMTTKSDFTMMGGLFFILAAVLLGASLLGFFFRNRIYSVALSSLCVVIYGLFLIYDTQLIIGNKRHALSYDDYVLGSLSLYIDIVTIFMELLNILNN